MLSYIKTRRKIRKKYSKSLFDFFRVQLNAQNIYIYIFFFFAEVCCVPDIWMTEGTLMRLPATPINSLTPLTSPNTPNGHTPTLSNGTSPQFHPLAQYNNESSNGSTPTPTLKIERPTPTATPTSGLPLTPNPMGTPLLHHPNFTAIMEPVQNMPLDLVRPFKPLSLLYIKHWILTEIQESH